MNVSEPTNEVKIRAEHVDFSYEKTQTLFDINLEFRNHEVTALIGPSGCGKSTFLRTLSRMNELICDTTLKGKILLDGEDIYAPNYDVVQLRQRVGMVFQKPTPFPKSIFENVAYGLRVAGISNRSILSEKVEESLRCFVGRSQGSLERKRLGPFGRSAAASLHCPRPRRGA